MKPLLQPWQLLLLILAGWINHREQDVIEYLRAENRVLREKLGKKRILLNDDQRRRLAVKGKILGRKMLAQVATNKSRNRRGKAAKPGWNLTLPPSPTSKYLRRTM
jgi:hypothetical protein